MSFVAEILCSAEKVELEDLSKKVPDIVASVDDFKRNVLHYMEEIYVDFSRPPKRSTLKAFLSKADHFDDTVSVIEQKMASIKINDDKEVKDNFATYKLQLSEAARHLSLVNSLIKMDDVLEQLEICGRTRKYSDCIKLTKDINQINNDDGLSDATYLEVFNSLLNKWLKIQHLFTIQLIREYKECIQYNDIEPFSIAIKKCANIEDIIKATSFYKNDLILEAISFIWDKIFKAILKSRTSIAITEKDRSKLVLNVVERNERPPHSEVVMNIIAVAEFLHNNLNDVLFNGEGLIDNMAPQLHRKLSELIIQDCISHALQSNNNYYIVEEVVQFQNELINCGFLPVGADLLTSNVQKYVSEVDELFIDKKCQAYLNTAIEIMKKDLHDMVEIKIPAAENVCALELSNISPHSFISKSLLDLTKLIDGIMCFAVNSDFEGNKLYCTVVNILNSYGPVVQMHHQEFLQTIPRQVALFHNNCMYLSSYKLSAWFEAYGDVTTHMEQMLLAPSHLLREIGNKALIDSLEQQIKQIEEILKESGLTSRNTLDKLEPITEESIRQCLQQQESLQTAWHNVLSPSDYNRSIGAILNVLCNFIINELVKIEHIAAEPTEQLADILKGILSRGPKLFTDPKDVHLYVESWYRFNELVFILSSSLVDICDRWADSKGHLALQFQPEEVQKLIRALFQTTHQRAAALTKIVKHR